MQGQLLQKKLLSSFIRKIAWKERSFLLKKTQHNFCSLSQMGKLVTVIFFKKFIKQNYQCLDMFQDVKNQKGQVVLENKFTNKLVQKQIYADISLSLREQAKYQCKAMVSKTCTLLCLDKEHFRRFFGNQFVIHQVKKQNALEKVELFTKSPISDGKKIILEENFYYYSSLYQHMQLVDTYKDEIIYSEGQPFSNIYIVYEGSFEIYKKVPQQKGFIYARLNCLQNGYFGIEEMYENLDQRFFSVRCTSTKGVLYKIQIKNFNNSFISFLRNKWETILENRIKYYKSQYENLNKNKDFQLNILSKTVDNQKEIKNTPNYIINLNSIIQTSLQKTQSKITQKKEKLEKLEQLDFSNQSQIDMDSQLYNSFQTSRFNNSTLKQTNMLLSQTNTTRNNHLLDRKLQDYKEKSTRLQIQKTKYQLSELGGQRYDKFKQKYLDNFIELPTENFNFAHKQKILHLDPQQFINDRKYTDSSIEENRRISKFLYKSHFQMRRLHEVHHDNQQEKVDKVMTYADFINKKNIPQRIL